MQENQQYKKLSGADSSIGEASLKGNKWLKDRIEGCKEKKGGGVELVYFLEASQHVSVDIRQNSKLVLLVLRH